MNDDRQNVTANGESAAAGFDILWQAFAVAASPGGIAMVRMICALRSMIPAGA
jgi:hypothetical protein